MGDDREAWTPFQANKLGALAAAMLAPELGVGLASIAGFAAIALGKSYFLDPDIQRGFPVGEPWLILIYALFAGVILVYRLRGLAIEREMLRVQAEAAASEHLAQTFLRLSDYANTPIQTIAFATKLLRAKNRDDIKPLVDRLERAVVRLKELSDALTRYQKTHHWSPGEESLDTTTGRQRAVPRRTGGNDRRESEGNECFAELTKERLAIARIEARIRHRGQRRRPDWHPPPRVADIARDDVPVQMRHDVAERFHVDVVRLRHAHDRVLSHIEISAEGGPFRCRQLVGTRGMPQIENQDALPAVRLILRQVERGD